MKLDDLVQAYIDYKRSLGMRLRSQAAVLRAYCRQMGDVGVEQVKAESVLAFVAGTGPVTTRWLETYTVLAVARERSASSACVRGVCLHRR
jgi:integrase/recombinase XerD